MKGLQISPIVALLALLLAAGPTAAAESCDEKAEVAAQSGAKIGLLDLDYIFKNYPRFTEKMVELKADVQRAEEEVKKDREQLADMARQLQTQTVGTPEHAEMEAKITATRAQMAASFETQKKAFVRREGQLYYEVYGEIRREVEDYAKVRNITAVVRFSDTATGPGDPNAVRKYINRQVIWHDGACDLTRAILQRLEQKSKEEPFEPAEEPPAEEPTGEEPTAKESSAEDSPTEGTSCLDRSAEPSGNANEETLGKVTVAVIDVGYLFKNYSRYKEMQSDLKVAVEQAEESVKQKREELENMVEQLKVHITGTPQHAQLEKKIAAENAKATNDIKFQQRDFQRRAARMSFEAYEDVVAAVEDYAKTQELQCVLRFNGTKVNAGVAQDVARRLQEPIIWHDGVSDVTQIILRRLEQRSEEQQSEPAEEPSEEKPVAKEPPLVPPTVDKPSTGDAPRLGRCGWRLLHNPV